jgi:predicted transcriptional regulator
MMNARVFARSLKVLAQVCSRDPEQVDTRLLRKLQEFGYIDEEGHLTAFGRKLLAYIMAHRDQFYP